jgi:hypothetical protein
MEHLLLWRRERYPPWWEKPQESPKPAPCVVEGDPYDLVGPPTFGYRIWSAPTPHRFHAPNIEKYDSEIDPKIWLVNYQLTMKAASTPDMFFMIQYLPIYLTNSARNWLNNLCEGTIKWWADLERAFCNHFEGAFTKLATSWDLLGCNRKTSKSLCDYIKCFTQCKNKLEDVPNASIVTAFTAGVDNEPLIRDIGQRKNSSLRDMFALAHKHADCEDCFNTSNGKYKWWLTDDADWSSLTKKDHKHRDELVANTEK